MLFTLDETSYARELAPLAGVYPALRLGPAWWFHDSPEGMRRFREMATETAGFYNTVGFNDDTRAFPSIPARHDVARRVDCAFLARLVAEHRLDEDEAHEVAHELAYAPRQEGVSALNRTSAQGRNSTHDPVWTSSRPPRSSPPSMAGSAPAPDGAALVRHPSRRLSDRRGGQVFRRAGRESAPTAAMRSRCTIRAQLGQEADTIEQVRSGVIDLNRVSMAPWNGLVPQTHGPLAALYLPLAPTHARNVMDGPIGDEILAAFEPHGVVGLAFYDGGARSFYNSKKPINSLADLAGMKFRVMQSDIFVDMVAALGATATPMPYGEVYSAIETGVIDGAENNFPSYDSAKHFEVAKYYSLDEHLIVPEVLRDVQDRLGQADARGPGDLQAGRQGERGQAVRALGRPGRSESRKIVEDCGLDRSTTPDKQPFIDAMKPVYDKYVTDPELQDLVARIQATEG